MEEEESCVLGQQGEMCSYKGGERSYGIRKEPYCRTIQGGGGGGRV